MTAVIPEVDVVVVGAGPVGLLAGILAHDAGLRVVVVDREAASCTHSRAIGIHPPALELLAGLAARGPEGGSLADAFVEAGIRVRRGHALAGPGRALGCLDFDLLGPPWPFVLTLPQHRTERILEAALLARVPEGLVRSTTVRRIKRVGTGRVEVVAGGAGGGEGRQGAGSDASRADSRTGERRWRAAFVLACDGKRSTLREQLGIGFEGGPYPHRYLMGDFATGTEPGSGPGTEPGTEPGRARGPARPNDAAIFLSREGLVESFPLEPGVRRWVIQGGEEAEEGRQAGKGRAAGDQAGDMSGDGDRDRIRLDELIRTVRSRTGIELAPGDCRMLSAFGVERYHATRVWKDRVLLLGDAAHVVSPIGGQGMNLGWIHAREAVDAVRGVLRDGSDEAEAARGFEARVRSRARTVAGRAEQNMRLGHRPPGGSRVLHHGRALLVRFLLASPWRRILARRFTMQGLGTGSR